MLTTGIGEDSRESPPNPAVALLLLAVHSLPPEHDDHSCPANQGGQGHVSAQHHASQVPTEGGAQEASTSAGNHEEGSSHSKESVKDMEVVFSLHE